MWHRRVFLITTLALASTCLIGASADLLHAEPKAVLAVVVAKESPLESVSLRDLKRLYLSEQVNGPGGQRLIALNHERGTMERTAFDEHVLGMTPDEVGRYWIDRKIRGQLGPPKTVSPLERLRAAIKRVDGTLTYLRLGDIQDGMRVLRVDGKAPGDPGYPLAN